MPRPPEGWVQRTRRLHCQSVPWTSERCADCFVGTNNKALDAIERFTLYRNLRVSYLGERRACWLQSPARSENGATLLQSDVLQACRRQFYGSTRFEVPQVLHRIIGHNRAPELVSEVESCVHELQMLPLMAICLEAFTLLYRLCDAPAPAVDPLAGLSSFCGCRRPF